MTDLTRRSDQDSATVRDRDRRHLWHIWSPVRADLARLCLSSGTGHTVRDIDGRSYIDASSLNLSCGYAHPDLVGAVQTQAGRLHGYDISVHGHEISGALAARIAGLMPPELSRTLLTNSGTEGIEAALLIAGMYAQLSGEPRTRVVTFARGYHGSTLLSREMSGLPHLAHPFASPLDVTRIDLPLSARETRDVAGLPALVEEFRRALLDVEPPPLAVLIEPLLNVGGGVVLPPGFLTEVRRLCDESGALLVLDEVSTGYGRTGRMFAFQHDDVVPDIVVTSKGLAAGYAPISAVSVRESIYRQFEQDPLVGGLRFGQTTSGHAISCAAALATLDVIERDGLVDRADRAGRLLTSQIVSMADGDTVADVRGLGLFVSVEFTREPDAERVVAEAEARGLLLRRQGAVVMLVPPLTVDDAALELIADRFAAALKEVAA